MINSNKLNRINLEIRVPWKVLYLMRISVPDTIIKLYAVMGHGSCTKIAVLWRTELSRESNLAKIWHKSMRCRDFKQYRNIRKWIKFLTRPLVYIYTFIQNNIRKRYVTIMSLNLCNDCRIQFNIKCI